MKWVGYLEKPSDLPLYVEAQFNELILAPQKISRFGKLEKEELESLAQACHQQKILPLLEWDILMTEEEINSSISFVQSLNLNLFSALRVQDFGALEYAWKKLPCRWNLF